MIPRRLRLSRASFPAPRQGFRASSPSFTLLQGPSKEGGCAAIVSKAVVKKSTGRHLLKRRMLVAMRPWCTTNRYLVLYAKKDAATLSYKELHEELTSLLTSTLR